MIWSIVSAKRRNVGPATHRRNELRKRCLLSPTGNRRPEFGGRQLQYAAKCLINDYHVVARHRPTPGCPRSAALPR